MQSFIAFLVIATLAGVQINAAPTPLVVAAGHINTLHRREHRDKTHHIRKIRRDDACESESTNTTLFVWDNSTDSNSTWFNGTLFNSTWDNITSFNSSWDDATWENITDLTNSTGHEHQWSGWSSQGSTDISNSTSIEDDDDVDDCEGDDNDDDDDDSETCPEGWEWVPEEEETGSGSAEPSSSSSSSVSTWSDVESVATDDAFTSPTTSSASTTSTPSATSDVTPAAMRIAKPSNAPQPTTSSTTWSTTTTTSSTTTWSAPASPSPSPSSGGSSGDTVSGIATFFTQDGNPGACGNWNSDSTYLVAVRKEWYQDGANCGKMLTITAANGKTVQAPIQDLCPGCDEGSIDMSTGLWGDFGYPVSAGIFDISWTCDECTPPS